ncbi:hypothetical protein AQI88_17240 [Streptomyces cellostaticus]|uniref:PsbP C-terminal domain-containing protein n=1 Tax=Streptomyces cellostaticus TaxID=67285 RepID=A0A101NLG9_9ACTN|nr:hypothetical protein AQI88_17240 [Streptomyces cellostaticus]GHI01915.1 hypothetical protein Scel_02360 [Streptomyces cellostaticus]
MAGLAALCLVAACAAAAAWWTERKGNDPLAGRPRVTDTRAGLSYAVPDGWQHDAAKDKHLVDAFSSQISKTSGAPSSGGGTVLTGRAGQVVPRADLRRAAESAARSNAEFFFPDQRATVEESHAAELDGEPAYTVALRIRNGDDGTSRLEMTLVTVHGERTAFLLGLTTDEADAGIKADIHAVVAGAGVV